MRLSFFGACRQITGSCYLLETENLKVLVDCGMYQEREFQVRNWKPFPFSPREIDYLVLTHVHLDHSGLIPKLVKEGFSGQILMTDPSQDLLPILLLDSARIQEEDAAYKKKRHKKENRKGPYPVVPIYTVEDAEACFPLFHSVPYGQEFKLSSDLKICFHDAGHILGSSMPEFILNRNGQTQTVVFSGDIGQWDKPLIKDPTVFDRADHVVMESLYGDRKHEDPKDVGEMLQMIIKETVAVNGNVLIPTFAIERAQELLYHLNHLVWTDQIPYMMMFLDSPMAVDATDVFLLHRDSFDKETQALFKDGRSPFHFPGLKLIRSVAESKAINNIRGSCIIMAGSGMCTGGRIKHHLKQNIFREESTILFVGYQAHGTLGRHILEGNERVRIHGQSYEVNSRIEAIHGFSAHADQDGLLRWLSNMGTGPKNIFLTHGDLDSATHLAENIRKTRGWESQIPEYLETYELRLE